MKSLVFIALFVVSLTQALAQDTGVGFMLGQPTGVSAKRWVAADRAIDAAAAWSIGSNPHFQLHSDYLWNKEGALYFQDNKPLDLYFGLGGRMDFDDEIEIGARIPVGLSYYFSERKAEYFGEFAPIVDLLPKTKLEAHLAVGLRIYF